MKEDSFLVLLKMLDMPCHLGYLQMILKKVINQSNIRSVEVPLEYNLRLDLLCGENKQFIKSKSEKIQLYKFDDSQSTYIEGLTKVRTRQTLCH